MILVTGSTGTVGRALVEALRERRAPFRALVRSDEAAATYQAHGVETVRGDFYEPESLEAALEGVDRVFLLSGGSAKRDEIEGNVVSQAARAGVKHLVKQSILDADGEAQGLHQWHGRSEEAIKASGLPYTFLRPNYFMQNFANLDADTIKREGRLYAPAGDARVSFIDVRDIAAVAAHVLTEDGHAGQVYTLTGPEALTFEQVAERLARATHKEVNYVAVPDEAAKQGMVGAGMPELFVDALIELFRSYRRGEASVITPTVEQITGRKPKTLEDYIRDDRQRFEAPL